MIITTGLSISGGMRVAIPPAPPPPGLYSWGYNPNGALGQNDRVYKSSPTQVGALANWSKVSTDGLFAMAILN